MAIKDTIESIKEHLEDAYGIAEEKGATIPSQKNMVNLADTISSISGGSPTPVSKDRKDVNFFDHEGIVHYSYTKDEFLALSEMPPNPKKEGLTAQGWNWSFEEAQDYVRDYGVLEIGQMYVTNDNTLRLYIELFYGNLNPYLTIKCDSIFTIDWGDGTIDTKTAGTITSNHTYSKEGEYVIKLKTNGQFTLQYNNNIGCVLLYNNSSTENSSNYAYRNCIKKIELPNNVKITDSSFRYCYGMKSISIPNNITTMGSYAFADCLSLNVIIIPNSLSQTSMSMLYMCTQLNYVSIPNSITFFNNQTFSSCNRLRKIILPKKITQTQMYLLQNNFSLSNVIIPNNITKISSGSFYNCYSLSVVNFTKHTIVPTLDRTDAFSYTTSDLKIIVPDNLYDEWIVATNWSYSSIVGKIIKESDYNA